MTRLDSKYGMEGNAGLLRFTVFECERLSEALNSLFWMLDCSKMEKKERKKFNIIHRINKLIQA